MADTNITGWLTDDEIATTKARIPTAMWLVEYELQEPSIEGRAIDLDKVTAAFDRELGEYEGSLGEHIQIEKPEPHVPYITGADWAKKQDWTILCTFRVDVRPWKCVAWVRLGRQPWPTMVNAYEKRLTEYPPDPNDRTGYLRSAHDATGVGDVVDDYLEYERSGQVPEPVVLTGQRRTDIFSDYVAAIEDDAVRYPFIRFAYDQHRYCTVDDLTRSGRDYHPPDAFVAGALAWLCRDLAPSSVASPVSASQTSKWRGR